MIPAYCKLVKCPHCGSKKEIIQLTSGNTFGAELWSDTKQIAPMLPKPSPVQKCPNCGHYFFLSEVEFENGNTYSFEEGWLSFEDSINAFYELNNEKAERLELLTIIIVWAYNDIVRKNESPTPEQLLRFKEIISNNLRYPIFSKNELFRSELYREIGEYAECINILSKYKPENEFIASIKSEIISKAEEKNNDVFRINS